jgi:hypothetical protein
MIDAQMNIAVFTDNRALFDEAVRRWRARVPPYIYLTSDGPRPIAPPGGVYNDPAKLRCRWLANAIITANCTVAGVDLFAEQQIRIEILTHAA